MSHVVVIGAGASGMMAAIKLKRQNQTVTLIEKNNKLGKKILATGNGRCNYTNLNAMPKHYNRPDFVSEVFSQFGVKETVMFFESLGIVPKVEDEGKTYPMSEQASSITEVLSHEIERLGVKVLLETSVLGIQKKGRYELSLSTGSKITCDQVVISTGGKAMPKSGSDGFGYLLAKALGHTVTDVFPALVKLELKSPHLKQIDGVKVKGEVSLIHNNHVLQTEVGDILFTKYGISGPTILQLSRKANQLLLEHQAIFLKVTLLMELDESKVMSRFFHLQDKTIADALVGLIHKKLIHPLLEESGIKNHKALVKSVDPKTLGKLTRLMFDWRFMATGFKGFDEAQVTAGGVSLLEINPKTLESKIQKGLYFTGEVLDVDGLCGGYNLQWAWSSGYVAACHAGEHK
ncbi:MAG: NAD(P)/FAD-dependent oxidoreductase [Acholeplasma sp.]|nr:NAD(P)/FAD-dependent oxidoreductase [Acholeplasma sp.]